MKSSAAGAGSFVGASSGSCDVKTVDFDLSVAVTPCALGQSGLIASTEGEIDVAFKDIAQQRVGALLVSSDPLFFIARNKLVALQTHYTLPTIFADREQAEAGGLISYGASRPEAYRQAGNYIGRVVKGEKPADLPVVLPTKYTLLINLKTAKAIGLTLPASLLARADEVIE